MESLGYAYKKLRTIKRHQVSKMIYGWQNTGHQRARITPNADSRCPLCRQINETQEHVLQCRDGRARACRYNALIGLRSAITTKGGGSITWTILHQCLLNWTNNQISHDTAFDLKEYTMKQELRHLIKIAIEEQHAIGWHQAIRGFLSITWSEAYNLEHPKSNQAGIRQQWTSQIIKALWTFNFTMWELRNKTLHSAEEDAKQRRMSPIDERIKLIYTQHDEFAASDQQLFDTPLEQRLKATQRAKQNWLTLVARYHPTTRDRKRGNQELLTKYYTRTKTATTTTATKNIGKFLHTENITTHRNGS